MYALLIYRFILELNHPKNLILALVAVYNHTSRTHMYVAATLSKLAEQTAIGVHCGFIELLAQSVSLLYRAKHVRLQKVCPAKVKPRLVPGTRLFLALKPRKLVTSNRDIAIYRTFIIIDNIYIS